MKYLFKSYELEGLSLPNRFVMAPMTRSRSANGVPDILTERYYSQRASAGLIITEGINVSQQATGYLFTPGLTMSMHRHFGQEVVLITQNPTKLNKDTLSNVTIHYVMRRKFGFEAANIWTFGEAMTTWGKSVADSALVTQGTILHDAPKDLCKRVMKGDRPFNPYKQPEQAVNYEYASAKENPQISNNPNPKEIIEPISLDQKASRVINGAHSL